MSRNAMLKVVNPLLFLALLVQAVTGIGMWLFGWETIEDVHVVFGVMLLVLAVVHLTLNWWWVRVAYRRGSERPGLHS